MGNRVSSHRESINQIPSAEYIPVCFIKNHNLVSTRRERDFLLRKPFDSTPHNIDT